MVLVYVICCIGHCFGAAPSLSLSLSLIFLCYLSVTSLISISLYVCSSLSHCCAGVRKLQQTTKNFLECFCVYVRVCVAGGWLLWWHDSWNARIVVDVLENCFTVLRVRSFGFCWFLASRNIRDQLNYIENFVFTILYTVYAPSSRKHKHNVFSLNFYALRDSGSKIKDIYVKPKHSLATNINF